MFYFFKYFWSFSIGWLYGQRPAGDFLAHGGDASGVSSPLQFNSSSSVVTM